MRMALDTFDVVMIDIRLVRLRVQRTYFDIGIADRRTVPLRADGFGYVRRRHDGYQDCPPVRVQRTYFDIEHGRQKASPLACGWFWIRSTSS